MIIEGRLALLRKAKMKIVIKTTRAKNPLKLLILKFFLKKEEGEEFSFAGGVGESVWFS